MTPEMHPSRSIVDKLAEFRLIPRIETYPKAVLFAQTTLGRIAILATFGLGLYLFLQDLTTTFLFVLFIAFITFMPKYRHIVLAVAPIILVVLKNYHDPVLLGLNLAVIAFGGILYWCVMRWPKSRFSQRPVSFLIAGFSLLIAFACVAAPHSLQNSILWDLVGLMVSYMWFIAYALTDRSSKPARDLKLELATFHPVWGSTNVPFPKGAAYLRRIEAQNPEQLAIVQLKGLKLLAWAMLLVVFQSLWRGFFHSYMQIPTSTQAFAMNLQGTPIAWHLEWEGQILAFFELILSISIFGHRIIACCRMAGYNALRNTYRPLSSTTIAEFFNRLYYYFKELLVDFFFYPTFLRYWKGHRRLRMVFATFAAAFFGNAFFHFTRDWQFIRNDGFWNALVRLEAYMFYCFALAAGLSISQLRKRRPSPTGFVRGRLLPAMGVCLFYCLLNVFDSEGKGYPFMGHFRYFASLFFISF
jgi:hypothetical protein